MAKITVLSFGYKYEAPTDVNLLFDVRFLPNPHYNEELRPFCGMDEPIRKFMESHSKTQQFCETMTSFVNFYIKEMEEANRDVLISFGCTGGKHRSVYMAEYLCEYLKKEGFEPQVIHRDLNGGKK